MPIWESANRKQIFKIHDIGIYWTCLKSRGTFLHLCRVRNAPTLHLMKTDSILVEGLMYRKNSAQKAKMTYWVVA